MLPEIFHFLPVSHPRYTYLETASDDWFGDFDGDGIPEIPVGRLPVRTAEEARAVVAKIVGYEGGASGGEWTQEVLLVADRNDGFDFEEATRGLVDLFPADRTVRGIFLGESDPGTARSELLGSLNAGASLVNYLGHGSVEVWSKGGILTSRDAPSLTNGPRLPFVVSMNCLNGFFHDLYTESLGEALLNAEGGGAVAVWASSGLTGPEEQVEMDRALLKALFGESRPTIGEAIREAKAAVSDGDIRRTWILFGDPATRLPSK